LWLLANDKKLSSDFSSILGALKSDIKFIIVSLDIGIVEGVVDFSSKLEMHDSIIVASAQMLKLPIVTKDRTIRKMYKETIW